MLRTGPFLITLALTLNGCTSYVLPVPGELASAAALPVAGASGFKQKQMTVGSYVARIDRGSTYHRHAGVLVAESRKRQPYSFVITNGTEVVFTGGCFLTAEATNVAAPGGVQITAHEKAELDCEMLPKGASRDSWRLKLSGDTDNPLNGELNGASRYSIAGHGTAIGSTRHGPTAGYYLKHDDRTVASVQVVGKRQVLFAPGAQSNPLLAAAVVLLLIDESVREVDD